MKLQELAQSIGGTLQGPAELEITGAAGLKDAQPGHVTFLADMKLLEEARASAASCVLVRQQVEALDKAQVIVDDPYLSFVQLVERFYPRDHAVAPGISPLAHVDCSAEVAGDVCIGPFAYIGPGARIGQGSILYPGVFIGQGVEVGQGCLLYPHVVLMEGTRVGQRVIIHAGAVLGADGFGFLQRQGRNIKIPQVGGVLIEDDVEIGANTTIDRATSGLTTIGRGTKIDNLAQIAHNVSVGEEAIIVAQAGIAGSTTIGSRAIVGGQSAIKDHVSIAEGAVIIAQSGVAADITERGIYAGTPAIKHRDWLRASAALTKLPELIKRVAALERAAGQQQEEQQ